MSNLTVIVTGAGSGIGKALTELLAQKEINVIAVGRRQPLLAALEQQYPAYVKAVAADIATAAGRQTIVNSVPKDGLLYLVNNAGSVEPVATIDKITVDAMRDSMAVNVDGAVFLTQALLPRLHAGRVLFVNSGAARFAIGGFSIYAMAKAALYSAYQHFQNDCPEVSFASVEPGMVNTPMTQLVRKHQAAAADALETVYQSGDMITPEICAQFFAWILLETEDVQFTSTFWDIYEPTCQQGWSASPVRNPLINQD